MPHFFFLLEHQKQDNGRINNRKSGKMKGKEMELWRLYLKKKNNNKVHWGRVLKINNYMIGKIIIIKKKNIKQWNGSQDYN